MATDPRIRRLGLRYDIGFTYQLLADRVIATRLCECGQPWHETFIDDVPVASRHVDCAAWQAFVAAYGPDEATMVSTVGDEKVLIIANRPSSPAL